MLSPRSQLTAASLTKPWRYVDPGPRGIYHPETNPNGVITQLTSAENQLVQADIADFIRREVVFSQDVLGYKAVSDGSRRLAGALAERLNEYWRPVEVLSAGDVAVVGSATALHDGLGFCLFEAGEGVLVSRPYYGRFEIDFGFKAQVKVVAVDSTIDTCFLPSVVDEYQAAYDKALSEGIKIRAVMLVNPHNPLGICYPPETIRALMTFCQTHKLHLISDEIYALSVFPSNTSTPTYPFTSVLAIEQPGIDPDLLHVIYGISKDFALPGLRLGALLTRSATLKKSLSSILRFCPPSSTSLLIASTILENRAFCASFIEASRTRLAEAYAFTTARLDEMGIRYADGTNAGFFVFVDLSPFLVDEEGMGREGREQELAGRLLEGGVCVQPGEEHAVEVGWFRVVYSVERRVLVEGLKRYLFPSFLVLFFSYFFLPRRDGGLVRVLTWGCSYD
ncbi:unnamed protein product [Periconia digitata]|uniref:Aminotransferase class I/classII large domain-containing protein n=1 Tax=Periconia digitata TaxID=1303443 RepID=A0A9W4UUJ8_9PLEO|nr:unnamed protein product [Periconia digitata]